LTLGARGSPLVRRISKYEDVTQGELELSNAARLKIYAFEIFVAFLGIFSAISYFAAPVVFRNTAIHEAFGNWAYLWLSGYAFAGILIIIGLIAFKRNIESAGIVIFITSLLINSVATFSVFGLASLFVITSYIALMLTLGVRLSIIANEEYPVIFRIKRNG
jgi:hypothetical protein